MQARTKERSSTQAALQHFGQKHEMTILLKTMDQEKERLWVVISGMEMTPLKCNTFLKLNVPKYTRVIGNQISKRGRYKKMVLRDLALRPITSGIGFKGVNDPKALKPWKSNQ